MRGAGYEAVVLHRECPETKYYYKAGGSIKMSSPGRVSGHGNLRVFRQVRRYRFFIQSNTISSRRFASQDPARREKNCDYNIDMKMKNFSFELSIKITLIVDKKGITKIIAIFL